MHPLEKSAAASRARSGKRRSNRENAAPADVFRAGLPEEVGSVSMGNGIESGVIKCTQAAHVRLARIPAGIGPDSSGDAKFCQREFHCLENLYN